MTSSSIKWWYNMISYEYICQEIFHQYDIWLCLKMLDLPMYPLTYGRINREIDETPWKCRVLPPGLVGPAIHFTLFLPSGNQRWRLKSLNMYMINALKPPFSSGILQCKVPGFSNRFSIPGKESHQLDIAASRGRWRNGAMAAMWGLGMGYTRGNVHGFIHWKPLVSKFKWQLGIHYFRKPPCGLVFRFRFETCQCWRLPSTGGFETPSLGASEMWSIQPQHSSTEGMTGPTPGVLTINVDFKGHKKPFGPGGQHSQHPKRSGWVSVQSCESG